MANIKLTTKADAGFGLLVILIAVLCAVSLFTTRHVETIFGDYRQTLRQNLILAAMQEDLLEVRVAVYRYRINYDGKYPSQVAGNIAEIERDAATYATLERDPARLARLNEAQQLGT